MTPSILQQSHYSTASTSIFVYSSCGLQITSSGVPSSTIRPSFMTSALDVAVQRQVVQEMLHVRELFGTAIIIVTHDIGVVSAIADTVLVLKDGRKMEYGPAKEVLEHPQNDYTKELLSAVPKLKRS